MIIDRDGEVTEYGRQYHKMENIDKSKTIEESDISFVSLVSGTTLVSELTRGSFSLRRLIRSNLTKRINGEDNISTPPSQREQEWQQKTKMPQQT